VKRPAFQFYPADWRKDSALQSCSVAAQGLWINLMCVMHECDQYGHLSVNGKPMDCTQIGRLVGLAPKACQKLLDELENADVFSRNDEGVAYSRRMVNDERVRNVRAEAGRLGGNPALLNQEDKPKVNHTDNHASNRKPTPSSSSSSSNQKPPFELPNWINGIDWLMFEEHRKKLRKPMTDFAKRLVVKELARLQAEGHDPGAVLQQSVRRGWLDVFPVKGDAAPQKQGLAL
jgi:hypothetical protein